MDSASRHAKPLDRPTHLFCPPFPPCLSSLSLHLLSSPPFVFVPSRPSFLSFASSFSLHLLSSFSLQFLYSGSLQKVEARAWAFLTKVSRVEAAKGSYSTSDRRRQETCIRDSSSSLFCCLSHPARYGHSVGPSLQLR